MVPQRIAEEFEAVDATSPRFFAIGMHGESGHHADVRVDRMTDGNAFLLENAIIVVDPLPGLCGIDERKRQRADTEPRREPDRLAVGARDPDRRMRLLHRLWHQIPARHFEEFASESRIRIHRHHVEALLGRLAPHLALLLDGHAVAAELKQCG
jgi:hypothetical protein